MRHLMVACALLSSVLACSGSDGDSQEKGAATVSAVPILDIPGTTPAGEEGFMHAVGATRLSNV